jgi:hypothetical protein
MVAIHFESSEAEGYDVLLWIIGVRDVMSTLIILARRLRFDEGYLTHFDHFLVELLRHQSTTRVLGTLVVLLAGVQFQVNLELLV